MPEKLKLTVQLTKSESNLMWYYAINVSADVAEQFIEGVDRRVICTLPDGDHFHCALFASKQGGYKFYSTSNGEIGLG